ncbi:Uncharacterized protein Fot_12656 [Forsythia ovata]|uniref:Uncharacterized protein n=1 Tax=Forsythia ovata TaxID=205694 RepID=A0ABD1WN72_9LAMI
MPQVLVPLVDLGEGDDELGEADSTSTRGRDLEMRNTRYAHQKTRSMSPFRTTQFEYHDSFRSEPGAKHYYCKDSIIQEKRSIQCMVNFECNKGLNNAFINAR